MPTFREIAAAYIVAFMPRNVSRVSKLFGRARARKDILFWLESVSRQSLSTCICSRFNAAAIYRVASIGTYAMAQG